MGKANKPNQKPVGKPQPNKHKGGGKGVGGGAPYKKPAHGKAAFVKSKDAQKHVRNFMSYLKRFSI